MELFWSSGWSLEIGIALGIAFGIAFDNGSLASGGGSFVVVGGGCVCFRLRDSFGIRGNCGHFGADGNDVAGEGHERQEFHHDWWGLVFEIVFCLCNCTLTCEGLFGFKCYFLRADDLCNVNQNRMKKNVFRND